MIPTIIFNLNVNCTKNCNLFIFTNKWKIRWFPELEHHVQNRVPIILVGTKYDLRDDPSIKEELSERNQSPVTAAEAEKVKKEIEDVGSYNITDGNVCIFFVSSDQGSGQFRKGGSNGEDSQSYQFLTQTKPLCDGYGMFCYQVSSAHQHTDPK